MSSSTLAIAVECYAGYRGEQIPRTLVIGSSRVEVAEVIDQWLSPDHRYFKVRDGDAHIYIVRHDPASHAWELTMYQR